MSSAIRNSLKSKEPLPSESNILTKNWTLENTRENIPEYMVAEALSVSRWENLGKELEEVGSRQLAVGTLRSGEMKIFTTVTDILVSFSKINIYALISKLSQSDRHSEVSKNCNIIISSEMVLKYF